MNKKGFSDLSNGVNDKVENEGKPKKVLQKS